MKTIVVYESFWGNTAAIARAIAEGAGAPALTTSEATPDVVTGSDILIVGAPVLGFTLPSERMRESLVSGQPKAPAPADISHPSMRSWLASVPKGNGRAAAFETRIWWSPGGSVTAILRVLRTAGYRPIGRGEKFIVEGTYGPLRDGELERARRWGEELVRTAVDG
jgi:hypothetical protein